MMSKRGENIYKRKDQRWEGRFKVGVNSLGKAAYQSVYAHSYMECKNKLKALNSKSAAPVMPTATVAVMTFEEVCQQWLLYIKPTVKDSTFAAYHYIVARYLLAYFAAKNVSGLSKTVADGFIGMLLKNGAKDGKRGLSVRTVNNILFILKAICGFAELQFSIPTQIKKVRITRQCPPSGAVLTPGEWELLRKRLNGDQDKAAVAIAIGMYTGLRIGELCALKKKDLDFTEKTLHVQRTVQRIKNMEREENGKTKVVLGEPKSANSSRKIPIPEVLIKSLQALCKGKDNEEFVLGIDGKKALEPRTLQYRFKAYLKKLGMRAINFHALRHTFATRCVEKNVDIKTLSELLGHANVKITLERYVHSSMDFKRVQINRLSEAV